MKIGESQPSSPTQIAANGSAWRFVTSFLTLWFPSSLTLYQPCLKLILLILDSFFTKKLYRAIDFNIIYWFWVLFSTLRLYGFLALSTEMRPNSWKGSRTNEMIEQSLSNVRFNFDCMLKIISSNFDKGLNSYMCLKVFITQGDIFQTIGSKIATFSIFQTLHM